MIVNTSSYYEQCNNDNDSSCYTHSTTTDDDCNMIVNDATTDVDEKKTPEAMSSWLIHSPSETTLNYIIYKSEDENDDGADGSSYIASANKVGINGGYKYYNSISNNQNHHINTTNARFAEYYDDEDDMVSKFVSSDSSDSDDTTNDNNIKKIQVETIKNADDDDESNDIDIGSVSDSVGFYHKQFQVAHDSIVPSNNFESLSLSSFDSANTTQDTLVSSSPSNDSYIIEYIDDDESWINALVGEAIQSLDICAEPQPSIDTLCQFDDSMFVACDAIDSLFCDESIDALDDSKFKNLDVNKPYYMTIKNNKANSIVDKTAKIEMKTDIEEMPPPPESVDPSKIQYSPSKRKTATQPNIIAKRSVVRPRVLIIDPPNKVTQEMAESTTSQLTTTTTTSEAVLALSSTKLTTNDTCDSSNIIDTTDESIVKMEYMSSVDQEICDMSHMLGTSNLNQQLNIEPVSVLGVLPSVDMLLKQCKAAPKYSLQTLISRHKAKLRNKRSRPSSRYADLAAIDAWYQENLLVYQRNRYFIHKLLKHQFNVTKEMANVEEYLKINT